MFLRQAGVVELVHLKTSANFYLETYLIRIRTRGRNHDRVGGLFCFTVATTHHVNDSRKRWIGALDCIDNALGTSCTLLAITTNVINATCNATYLSSSTRWDYRVNDNRRSTFCTSGVAASAGLSVYVYTHVYNVGECIVASTRGRRWRDDRLRTTRVSW